MTAQPTYAEPTQHPTPRPSSRTLLSSARTGTGRFGPFRARPCPEGFGVRSAPVRGPDNPAGQPRRAKGRRRVCVCTDTRRVGCAALQQQHTQVHSRLRRTPPIPMQVPVHASRSSVCVLCVLLQSECGNAVRVARVRAREPRKAAPAPATPAPRTLTSGAGSGQGSGPFRGSPVSRQTALNYHAQQLACCLLRSGLGACGLLGASRLGLIRAQASVCARVQVIACEAGPGPLVRSVRSRSSV